MKIKLTLTGALILGAMLTHTPNLTAADTNKSPADSKLDELFPDVVVARGKGVEIKRSRLEEAVTGYRANATARGVSLTTGDLPLLEKSAFDHMVEVQLLNSIAVDSDREKAKKETEKEMDTILKRAGSEELFTAQLKSLGMTPAEFRSRVNEETIASQVLRDKVTVTDAEVKKFYEDNPLKFEQPEMVRVSHILLSINDDNGAPLMADVAKAKKTTADDVAKRAKAGENFADLAKKYSDDKGSKEKGGELSAFSRGQLPFKEFESAAFSLKTNQVSDVVTTKLGYHIIKLEEKIPATKLELAAVSDKVKSYLENVEMQKVLPTITADLRKKADIQILDDQVKRLLTEAEEKLKASEDKQNAPIPLPTNSPASK